MHHDDPTDLAGLAADLGDDARTSLWRRAVDDDTLPSHLVAAAARAAATTGDADLTAAVVAHPHADERTAADLAERGRRHPQVRAAALTRRRHTPSRDDLAAAAVAELAAAAATADPAALPAIADAAARRGAATAADACLRADALADALADAATHASTHAWTHRVPRLLTDLPRHHDDPDTLAAAVTAVVRAAATTPRPIDRLVIAARAVAATNQQLRAGDATSAAADAVAVAVAGTLAEIAANPTAILHADVDPRRDGPHVAVAAACAHPSPYDVLARLSIHRRDRLRDTAAGGPGGVDTTRRAIDWLDTRYPQVVRAIDTLDAVHAVLGGDTIYPDDDSGTIDPDDVDGLARLGSRHLTAIVGHPDLSVAGACRLAFAPHHHTHAPALRHRLRAAIADPRTADDVAAAAAAAPPAGDTRATRAWADAAAAGLVPVDAAARAADTDPTGTRWHALLSAADGRDPAYDAAVAARAPLRALADPTTGGVVGRMLHRTRVASPEIAAALARQLAAAVDDPDRAALLPQWDGPADTLDHTAAALSSHAPDAATPSNDVDADHHPDTDDVGDGHEPGGDGHEPAPPVVSDTLTTLWRAVLAAAGPLDAATLHAAARYADASGDPKTAAALAARDDLPAALRAHAAADRRAAVRAAVLSRDDATSDEIAALAAGETRATVLTAVAAHAPAGHPAVAHAVRVAADRRSPRLLTALLPRRDLAADDATTVIRAAGAACPHVLHRKHTMAALLVHPDDDARLHPDADTRAAAILAALDDHEGPADSDGHDRPRRRRDDDAARTLAEIVRPRRRRVLAATAVAATAHTHPANAAVIISAAGAAALDGRTLVPYHSAALPAHAADPDDLDLDNAEKTLRHHVDVAAAIHAAAHRRGCDTDAALHADAVLAELPSRGLHHAGGHVVAGERLAVRHPRTAAAAAGLDDAPQELLDAVAAAGDDRTVADAARASLRTPAGAARFATALRRAGRSDALDDATAGALALRAAADGRGANRLDRRLIRAAADALAASAPPR